MGHVLFSTFRSNTLLHSVFISKTVQFMWCQILTDLVWTTQLPCSRLKVSPQNLKWDVITSGSLGDPTKEVKPDFKSHQNSEKQDPSWNLFNGFRHCTKNLKSPLNSSWTIIWAQQNKTTFLRKMILVYVHRAVRSLMLIVGHWLLDSEHSLYVSSLCVLNQVPIDTCKAFKN